MIVAASNTFGNSAALFVTHPGRTGMIVAASNTFDKALL
jgi:hypothetical protein